MASSSQRVSASLSSTEPSAPQWKYDVFLSFRGIDTRKGITFELYDGLKNRGGIATFMDDQKLEVGESISPSLLKAIEQSRFAIIVLSRNYASSSWCLEELTKIVDCMKDKNRILPLFYQVEPADVRHQKNSFEVAFKKHEATKRHDRETVKQWRDALKTVGNFSGWDTQNYKTERELVEAIVEFVCNKVQHVGYLADYKSNHQNLQTKLKDLGAARDEVQHKVDQVTRIGCKRIETSVENWMTRVNAIITEAQTFLKDGRHGQTECLDGSGPNLELCNQLSKESAKLVEEIVQLYGKKEFSNFAYDVLPQEVCLFSTGHYTAFHSRNSIVASVMNELRSPDIEMILVYGIGGVGKTTLVEQVLRQAKHDNLFDDVVMVRDVKQNPDHQKIQREIAKKLGLTIDENDTLAERAPKLCDRIKDRRTLIVLDDVWEKIDLMAIGLPCLVNCKVVLTCRSRKDLSMDMRAQKDFPLDVLNEEEAWRLFEKMAGEVVKDRRIREVAMKVARKCGGLPLLIVTVARARKGKNKLHAWKDTLRLLTGFDKKEMTEKTYLALEWSYDQLEDKELKLLFLLCGIFVDKNHIYLEHLCKYGMGLDLFKNVDTMEEARDLLSTLVEKLIDSCLLFESDKNKYFRMHDLVCEVARRIASRDQHILSVKYGGELKDLSLESSNILMLSEVPRECPKLEMFYLYRTAESDKSVEIPSNFFSEMEKLKVLGLTELHMLSLPSSLQLLKNLQTLCLEQCELGDVALVGHLSNLEILSFAQSGIRQLPKEIGQLIRLRWLDLSDCDDLEVISPDVISKLERLEDLTMRNSFYKWEAERGGSNASLLELKLLSQLTALEIYIPDADILPTNLFSNKLVRYQIYIGDEVWEDEDGEEKTMAETTLNTLKLKLNASNEWDQGLKTLLKGCEDLSLDGTESVKSIIYQSDIEDFQQLKHLHLRNNVNFTYTIDRKVVFPNLTTLSVNSCDELEFLFSISMAKSLVELKHLNVFSCKIMEEIVSTRDLSNEETIDNIVFCKLESLTLAELPKLARFCTKRYIECPPEKKFDTEMGASICDPRISKKLDVNNETTVQNCLFDAQVKFPSLEKLKIKGTRKLQTIWNNQLADQGSFCELREVDISYCKSLMNMFVPIMMGRLNALETLSIKNCNSLEVVFEIGGTDVEERHVGTSSPHQLRPFYCQSLGSVTIRRCKRLQKIFPALVAKGLQKLYQLKLVICDEVEEIIFGDEGLETTPPQFVFPKVTTVVFSSMHKLSRFYPSMHASKWPLLEYLWVDGCDKVKMFAAELPIKHELDPLIKHSLFLIDKDSFPNLEELRLGIVEEIWSGRSSPAHFFPKLKCIEFSDCVCSPFSKQAALLFLDKLHNLDTLKVKSNDLEEIFVNEEMNSGGEMEIHAVGTLTFPRVKHLDISRMNRLLHLGNHNCHPAGPLFPNLDTLEVSVCDKLKSVESSAISFRNLTSLDVSHCDGLEYLTSYSVAKSLMQLTKLHVSVCSGLREIIVASNEDDHCEIVFSRLQHLILSGLPRLQGFCSGNCIVKLPSSTDLHVDDCRIELEISSEGVLLCNSNPEPTDEHDFGDEDGTLSVTHKDWEETLSVAHEDWEEIFVNEEMNSGGEMKIRAVGSLTLPLPRVERLDICHMKKLLHLGNHNSQPAGPLFPNLDTLEVFYCPKLKSVESSAISFRNLTTLKVGYCGGLEYLTSYSVAKSLMQLTTLDVKYCGRLREIIKVASNEDDHDSCEIAFSRLRRLTLHFLPRLRRFCWGNCIVKLPSSTKLDVFGCGIELEISSQEVLLSKRQRR